jgi:hypothetical protein
MHDRHATSPDLWTEPVASVEKCTIERARHASRSLGADLTRREGEHKSLAGRTLTQKSTQLAPDAFEITTWTIA